MNKEKAKVICLTPTKNEEWIIERFISAAALWADTIIIADQMSSDRTIELAQKCSKVRIIKNSSTVFNENERQKLLIDEARKISGKKLLLALDADEFLTGNFSTSEEWSEMLYADEGTVFSMEWPFICDNYLSYWNTSDSWRKFATVDNGCLHVGTMMHSVRIPVSLKAKEVFLKTIKVMHFQYTDWKRMEQKHLWYQCYERVTYPQKSVFEIYRIYHHMYTKKSYKKIPEDWFAYYIDNGVNIRGNIAQDNYWWDEEIKKYLNDYGPLYFKYIDFKDNRNIPLLYLRYTQKLFYGKIGKAFIRRTDRIMEKLLLYNKETLYERGKE